MDNSGFNAWEQTGPRRTKSSKTGMPQQYDYGGYGQGPELFNDTSAPYPSAPPPAYMQRPAQGGDWNFQNLGQATFIGQQLLSDPMAAMTMNALAGQGREIVNEKLEKYVSISKLKYYFAVDTAYVAKKLALLFFPFSHQDWAIHYNQDEPVAPRYDVNAPDLYIPVMAFLTYILTAGYVLGSQNRFSPEQLGIHASAALGWLFVEIGIILFALYVLSTSSAMKFFDLIAFCSYKYVCMVAALLASVGFRSLGYFIVIGYCSISLGFFLLRTLRVLILPKATTDHYATGTRRSSYLLLGICIIQPVIMYLLTHHLVFYTLDQTV